MRSPVTAGLKALRNTMPRAEEPTEGQEQTQAHTRTTASKGHSSTVHEKRPDRLFKEKMEICCSSEPAWTTSTNSGKGEGKQWIKTDSNHSPSSSHSTCLSPPLPLLLQVTHFLNIDPELQAHWQEEAAGLRSTWNNFADRSLC